MMDSDLAVRVLIRPPKFHTPASEVSWEAEGLGSVVGEGSRCGAF